MDGITSRVVGTENPMSLSSRARRRRWDRFIEEFPDIRSMRVLDLGGTPQYWENASVRPARVMVVNLEPFGDSPLVTAVQGDACDPPGVVKATQFDLVVSNSLLEHVGGHAQRLRVTDVVASASLHWVQTPYRYFPIEPHWMFPGLQFLPFEVRVRLTQHWPLGNRYTRDRAAAIDSVNEIDLIGLTQMRSYFPDSNIWLERFSGLVKSMVAIKSR